MFPSDIYVYGKELKYMWDWDKKNLAPIAEDQQRSAKRRSVSNFRAVVTEKLKDHRRASEAAQDLDRRKSKCILD